MKWKASNGSIEREIEYKAFSLIRKTRHDESNEWKGSKWKYRRESLYTQGRKSFSLMKRKHFSR